MIKMYFDRGLPNEVSATVNLVLGFEGVGGTEKLKEVRPRVSLAERLKVDLSSNVLVELNGISPGKDSGLWTCRGVIQI